MMLRMLNVPAAWVATGDLGRLPSLFGADLNPAAARELQGQVAFTFEEMERPDVSIFAVPGVLDYIARLHAAIPHLLYFLAPQAEGGAMLGLAYSMLPDDERAAMVPTNQLQMSDEIMAGLIERLAAAAVYATRVGDDWHPVIDGLLQVFAPDTRAWFYNEVEQRLDS